MPVRQHPMTIAFAIMMWGSLTACATLPFTTASPGLTALAAEEPYLYGEPEQAMNALSETSLPQLSDRIENLYAVYEGELRTAREAQGGIVNGLLSVASLVLPLAGTVSAITLSNPDDVETVTVATGIATTVTVALNLLFKPGERARKASVCETFLVNAIESLEQRWDRDRLAAIAGTPDEWRLYLAVRGSLDAGRRSSC